MTTFTIPSPVALHARFAAGHLHVATGDAGTTTVDVFPGDPSRPGDVELAATTVVEQRGGVIVVFAPNSRSWLGRTPQLRVGVRVPPGTSIDVEVRSADVTLSGELGEVTASAASGRVAVERCSAVAVRTASGEIYCGRIDEDASLSTASGNLGVGVVGGSAELATASGDIAAARVAGDIKVRSASGEVTLKSTGGDVRVRTASGDIRLDAVHGSLVEVETASGDVEIGVADGIAAWLDVRTHSGDASSDLGGVDGPDPSGATVRIQARTHSGDIRIRRAADDRHPDIKETRA